MATKHVIIKKKKINFNSRLKHFSHHQTIGNVKLSNLVNTLRAMSRMYEAVELMI